MELPTVRTTFVDAKQGTTYEILAYRTITEQEALSVVDAYLTHHRGRLQPKRGSRIKLHSRLGEED